MTFGGTRGSYKYHGHPWYGIPKVRNPKILRKTRAAA